MTRSDLIKLLRQDNPYLSQQDVQRIVHLVFTAMGDALAGDHRIELRGFGVFSRRRSAARTISNPRTREMIEVPAKNRIAFRISKILLEHLNTPPSSHDRQKRHLG